MDLRNSNGEGRLFLTNGERLAIGAAAEEELMLRAADGVDTRVDAAYYAALSHVGHTPDATHAPLYVNREHLARMAETARDYADGTGDAIRRIPIVAPNAGRLAVQRNTLGALAQQVARDLAAYATSYDAIMAGQEFIESLGPAVDPRQEASGPGLWWEGGTPS